jgi:hypothetical protein
LFFLGLIVNLIRDNRINGNLIGTTKENSIFYPKVYTDAQSKYIESFFSQNGYIEYSLVRNLGVTDPEGQTKLVLKDRYEILFLISGCIDLLKYLPQLEMNIEQGLISNDYVDITTIMPNSFNENDIEKLLKSEASIKELIQSSGGELISNTFIISKELQEKINEKLNKICEECAEKVIYNYRCKPTERSRSRRLTPLNIVPVTYNDLFCFRSLLNVLRKCMLLFFKVI